MLETSTCYPIITSNDARYDGRLFVGVVTTGIYCRPVCTAKTPKPENCRFFSSAAAAEDAGFRPCLRCRPELAPGLAPIDAKDRLVRATLQRLESGHDGSLAALASELGVSDRHLRRVFEQELGTTPVRYLQTQRLLLAKRLLTDTALPVATIAMTAGFQSLSRFNHLFKERYRLAPTELRKGKSAGDSPITLTLPFVPPLDWPALLAFLSQRLIRGVESITGGHYRRTLQLGEHSGWLEASSAGNAITLSISQSLAPVLPQLVAGARHCFDLWCRPDEVASALGKLATGAPGLRLPGTFDGFEMAVRAILGQQVTVKAAHTLAGRLVTALGEPLKTPFEELAYSFPSPERMAQASQDQLGRLGILASRSRAILALARAVADGELVLKPGQDVDAQVDRLLALPGIGPWTADYIAMRALGCPDRFLTADHGVKKALGETNGKRLQALAEPWRPWRSYAVMHLWRSLAQKQP
ncbi:DNA-3-methyladenine glycosylase 2 [Gallaecimonas sp. GXIMD4217]|uniref:DNA-3-methyladenine glycosylase 2 n=1 Tax=Gallaecimonas sp. GXIMD4217 TaxID=3131927 RepID=UPI00311AFBE6